MSIIIPANSAVGGGFEVANSLRFNSGSSDYLTFPSPGTSGNRKTWTLSLWFKRANLGSEQTLFSSGGGHLYEGFVRINSSDRLEFKNDGQYGGEASPTRVLRDVGSWYHLCWAVDVTQGTNDNRWKIYLNGTLIPASEYSSVSISNADGNILDFQSNASDLTVGRRERTDNSYWDGYVSETVLIDGTQNAVTDFGEFDEDSGAWKAINVSGLTFGTNGFYLDFENSGALGNDAAGSNNFTVNNLTAIDQSTDTCTNNFATGNSLVVGAPGTYSEGNLKITNGSNNWQTFWSSIAVSQGKWWVEVKCTSGNFVLGISETTSNELYASGPEHFIGGFTAEIGYYQDGRKFVENSASSYGASFADGDFIGMALDLDSGTRTINFYKNGSAQGNITLPSSMETMTFGIANSAGNAELNFGSPSFSISSGNADGNGYGNFEYAVPSGHLSLNTKNLSEALS
tara:strand:- start:276 stop:1646 length:1371 start_codon:yes stop_codon:yes gene_type:complete